MTRILRLLLIAAVAWPLCQPMAAQDATSNAEKKAENVRRANVVDIDDGSAKHSQLLEQGPIVNMETIDDGENPIKVDQAFKILKSQKILGQKKPLKVVKVIKTRADVPEGHSQITLSVLDKGDPGTGVWGDNTGYQMLLDENHSTYGSTIPETGALTTSGDVSSSIYSLFEYKIPENADGALSTTNMIVSGTSSITIPAGTYDWCITNPTPGERMWIASTNGEIQGRYDDYVFESGFAYTFTVSYIAQTGNDNVDVDITSNFENPTNLVVSNITNHQATFTWNPGEDETSWNVEYKQKTDFNWTSGGAVSSANYSLENLDPLTAYQFRVQGNHAGGLSGWTLVTFKTANNAAEYCGPEDMGIISYALNDSYGDGWSDCAINIVDSETGVIIESITLESGSSSEGSLSICYGREVKFVWVKGDYPSDCSFTITDPNGDLIYSASTTNCNSFANGYVFKTYTMQMPESTEILDFESVDVNDDKTLTAYIYHQSSANVQATITTSSPFSVASSSVTLSPGLNSIPVTFTPSEARNYNGALTVVAGDVTTTIALKGFGAASGPEAVRDDAFFEGIAYDWTNDEGTHTSKLNEIATDPDQIIAMLTEVYTNQDVPGNFKRGYTASLGSESYDDVDYSAVGTIKYSGGTYSYDPSYGWHIPNKTSIQSATVGGYDWRYFPLTDYKPFNEGVTLLLVEVADDFDNKTYTGPDITDYNSLKTVISDVIKSVRVVSEAKRVGDDVDRGTLFKINCNKMNKFFLLAKGQLRLWNHSYYEYSINGCPYPGYFSYDNTFYDIIYPLTSNMFEQFSPVSLETGDMAKDLYQSLVNMTSFKVYHDCQVVPFAYSSNEPEDERHGHQFMMYGLDSGYEDCQDVHDLMFFVPDYRMMYDSNRDGNGTTQKFLNYNLDHQPTMGLFVIKQNPITGAQVENQETYKLHLTWTSNLLDFLPGEDGKYTLYRVITNPDGTKTYQKVGSLAPNQTETWDYVPMKQNGQQVTYVVQGQDVGEFLDLQMSNEESFIIPGLDRAEQIRIELNSDYYFSRYDAAEQKNYYSNSLIANNTIGTNVKPAYIENGTQFKFWRATIDEQTGNVVTPDEPFVVAEVSEWDPTTGGTLTYKDWNDQADFSGKPYKHGYHANVETSAISIDTKNNQISTDDEVVFDGLKLYDNFSVSVANNEHPAQYVYYVTLETAESFAMSDAPLNSYIPNAATWIDGKTFIYVEGYDTWTDMKIWAWNNEGNISEGTYPGNTLLTETEITNNGHKVWVWEVDENVVPTGFKFIWNYNNQQQQTNDYTIFVNGAYYVICDDGNYGYKGIVGSNQARSNTVSVPVYKTGMTMNPISAAQVEADTKHQFPAATKFDVNARYSSRSEILGYYIYRWADSDPEQPRTIYESDGEDASPQGQAGNQGEYYTVAMNTDFTGKTEDFGANYADVTASFEDNYMVNDAKVADTYTYAPVVELFAPEPAVNLPSGVDRTDYNTYGGPQQMSAGGIVKAEVQYGDCSTFTWTADGKTYRYYNVYIPVKTLSLPGDGEYEVVKVRAWRKAKSEYLGEEADKGYEYRLGYKVGTEYNEFMFDEADGCTTTTVLGADGNANTKIFKGTFGAVDVKGSSSITEVPLEIVVRVYFTKTSGSKSDAQKYYIAETTVPAKLTSDIPTAINGVEVMSNVVSKKYYNGAGIESDTPFQGVNIVVTRYSDGSTTTTKILK